VRNYFGLEKHCLDQLLKNISKEHYAADLSKTQMHDIREFTLRIILSLHQAHKQKISPVVSEALNQHKANI